MTDIRRPLRAALAAAALAALACAAPAANAAYRGVLDVDVTPPKIALTVPVDGAVYPIGKDLASKYKCTDTGSGIASCIGTAFPSGVSIDTATPGTKTFTVRSTDIAGNTSRTDVT